ncbi:MAG: DNA methyltransferase [Candidatus Kapaibacterium sp.]
MNNINLFHNFDFSQLNNPDFKEDSVREVLILPILTRLGYQNKDIVRSKSLQHPFIKIGSQKRQINIVPDYLFKVENTYAWVLDAKGPNEDIKQGNNVEQVYSYSMHPDIRTKYFSLCNGREFILFRQDTEEPILFFNISDIERYWSKLELLLSPSSFQVGKTFSYSSVKEFGGINYNEFNYLKRPLLDEIEVRKQAAKRHFGVHGYFTKQAWNVVQAYIENFSKPGDLVLDPFGGSGITAVESMMIDRSAINIDLNPMAIFIVNSLVAPVDFKELRLAFERIEKEFKKGCPTSDDDIKKALKIYPYPKGISLPKASDVNVIEELFSPKQLAHLSFLKFLILKEKKKNVRESLLLAFSSSLNKFNKTFHYTKTDGGGDSSPFRYYRYRIAPEPGELDLMNIFETKFKKLMAAKKDIVAKINFNTIDKLIIKKDTATDLHWIKNETVDYIYTDPPYGKKIPYLDLSVMWTAWLDLKVTKKDFELEAIEGGEHNKTKNEYNDLISKSIEEMYRVLKFDRWMSFVFAHKDPEFWHLIVNTAEKVGFEYAGAVKQANGQTSFKKRQNPFTVLAGQLIINFKKVRNPKAILKANLGMNISEIIIQTIEGIIALHNGATLEQINDELIIKGLELGFLDLLKKQYSDLTPLLLESFDYNDETHLFTIRKNLKFRTNIDINLRIRYYLFSYLRRQEIEKKTVTFDDIILYIMPLLKNGTTPENQTILNVLEDIAEKVGHDQWQLKTINQPSLFGLF